MARLPRLKFSDQDTCYHLRNRVAGPAHWFPFQRGPDRRRLFNTLFHFLSAYCCDVFAWELMGNHFHLVIRMLAYRELTRPELEARARRLYLFPERVLKTDADWKRFNQRLFDVSELMRNLDGAYATGFNRRHHRRGSLWAGRFQSTVLKNAEAVRECVFYVELNALRARLVQRPEDYAWGSAAQRASGHDQNLVPLTELMETSDLHQARALYRATLYHRGAFPSRPQVGRIPAAILRLEQARGFLPAGSYTQKQPFFSAGLLVGSAASVATEIRRWKQQGRYAESKQPVPQLGGAFHTIRDPRSPPRPV